MLLLLTVCYVGWRSGKPGARAGPLRLRHLLVAAGLIAALSGSARSPIPAVEPSEAELPRGVITKRLSRPVR